jgi:Holliday junction resolvase RusA-like endonuclease
MRPITFSVPGRPVPQPRAKICVTRGRPRGYTDHKHAIHAYRAAIAAAAKAAGATATDEAPITLIIDLVFVRPKSHYRATGQLTTSALKIPPGDCSNYLKGIEDAMNGVAWGDDVQVGKVIVEKSYGTEARTTVRIQ